MADPLSIAAGVAGVVTAGFSISTGLYDVIETYKDAPQELHAMALEIQWTSTMLKTVCELIDEHRSLYKTKLIDLLKDLRWRFKAIQTAIAKCIKPSRKSIRARIRYLFVSKRINGLQVKLESVKAVMALALSVAKMAETPKLPRKLARLRQEVMYSISSSQQAVRQLVNVQAQPQLPPAQRPLIRYDERPEAMATWMSLMLSAPTIPVERRLSDGGPRSLITQHEKEIEIYSPPGPRPTPVENLEATETTFVSGQVETRALDEFNLEWQDLTNDDEYTILVKNKNKPLDEFEVDMVTGTSVVMRATATPGWDIMRTPFMSMRPNALVNRLLADWTTVNIEEVVDEAHVDGDIGVRINEPLADVDDSPLVESSDEFDDKDWREELNGYDWGDSSGQMPHRTMGEHSLRGRQPDLSDPKPYAPAIRRHQTPIPDSPADGDMNLPIEVPIEVPMPPTLDHYADGPFRQDLHNSESATAGDKGSSNDFPPYVPPAKLTDGFVAVKTMDPSRPYRFIRQDFPEDPRHSGRGFVDHMRDFQPSRPFGVQRERRSSSRDRSESSIDLKRRSTRQPSLAAKRQQEWIEAQVKRERTVTEFKKEMKERWKEIKGKMDVEEDERGKPVRGRATTGSHSKGPFGERAIRVEEYRDDSVEFERGVRNEKDPPPGWSSEAEEPYHSRHDLHSATLPTPLIIIDGDNLTLSSDHSSSTGKIKRTNRRAVSSRAASRLRKYPSKPAQRQPSGTREARGGSSQDSSPPPRPRSRTARTEPQEVGRAASSSRKFRAATVSSEQDDREESLAVKPGVRETVPTKRREARDEGEKKSRSVRHHSASEHSSTTDQSDNPDNIHQDPLKADPAPSTSPMEARVDKPAVGNMSLDPSTFDRILELAREGAVAEHKLKEATEEGSKAQNGDEKESPTSPALPSYAVSRPSQATQTHDSPVNYGARDNPIAVLAEEHLQEPEVQDMPLSAPRKPRFAEVEDEADATSETAESEDSRSHREKPPSFVTDPPSSTSHHQHVPCSTPWQGAVQPVRPHIVPIYIRGNELGQTWFAGQDPVYIVQFSQDYLRVCDTDCCPDGLHHQSKPYLLISTDWVTPETLEQHGILFKIAWQSYLYLDPGMEYGDILTLFNFSWHLRQVHISQQIRRRKKMPVLDMEETPPPPAQFFREEAFKLSQKRLTNVEETKIPEMDGADNDDDVEETLYGVWNTIRGSFRLALTAIQSIH